MEQRISFITLGVRDLERSRRFYQEVMGWQESEQSQDGIAFFQAGGMVLALFPREDLAHDAGLADEGSGFSGFALAHNVAEREEVDALVLELTSKGAKILKPAADAFWGGRSAYFADPDGNPWEIAWNPGGYLDEAGNFKLE